MATPIIVFAFVFRDLMVALLLGPNWTQAVPNFRILAFGAFIEPISQLVGPSLLDYGKTKEYFLLGLVSSLAFGGFYWDLSGLR